MPAERVARLRQTALGRVAAAAIDSPIEVRHALRDDAGAFRSRGRAQRDIRFAARDVQPFVGGNQLHRDGGVKSVERAHARCDQAAGQHFAGRQAHRAHECPPLRSDSAFEAPCLLIHALGRLGDEPPGAREHLAEVLRSNSGTPSAASSASSRRSTVV